jgi:hypothetical protein
MTLTLPLTADLEERLTLEAKRQGVDPAEYALRVLDQHLPPADRRAALLVLLRGWVEEGDAEEQRQTGDDLVRALDEDRLADRKLFPLELEGVTW